MENSNEDLSKSARSGFDTAGKPIQTKPLGIIPTIGLVVVAAVIVYFWLGSIFGTNEVRNCIGDINGTPECSDCTTKPMNTTVNGKSYGECTANPGTGNYDDQCSLNCPKK